MRILKALGVGLVVGLLTGIVWTVASLQVQIWWQVRQQPDQNGVMGAGSVNGAAILFIALIGFTLGFRWMLRRSRRIA